MSRWTAERWAASSGIAFAIVFVVANLVPGSPPHYNATSDKILAYLNDHHRAIVISAILSGVLILLFLWFISSFAGMFRDAGERQLSTVMYGAGVATVAMAGVGDAVWIGVTQLRTTIDATTVQALFGMSVFFYLKLFWALAALAFATALATRRSKALPDWYAMLSLAGGVIFVLGGMSIRMHGFFSPAGAMTWIAFFVFAAWVLVSSALCVQKLATAPAMAPAMSPH